MGSSLPETLSGRTEINAWRTDENQLLEGCPMAIIVMPTTTVTIPTYWVMAKSVLNTQAMAIWDFFYNFIIIFFQNYKWVRM